MFVGNSQLERRFKCQQIRINLSKVTILESPVIGFLHHAHIAFAKSLVIGLLLFRIELTPWW